MFRPSFADRQRHLARLQVHRLPSSSPRRWLIEEIFAGFSARWISSWLLDGPVHHVDVLVAQLLDDRVDARTFHTDACAHRVDAFVVGFDGHLGPFARYADDFLDGDEAVEYLRHLLFEEPFEEFGCRAGEDDDRAVVAHLHLGYDGPDGVAFAEEVARYLFALRKYQFVVLVVEHEYLLLPHLIDLARDYLAHAFAVLLEQVGFFEIEDAGGEVLRRSESTARRPNESSFISSATSSPTS